jgi:hypothetical protein
MSIHIGNFNLKDMDAAKRKAIADTIAAMSPDQQRELIEQLSNTAQINAKFDANETKKRTAIANINAARQGTLGERAAINALEGNLRRAGISLDAIVEAPHKIDEIFASAGNRLSLENRMGAKGLLYRIGVIAA